MQTLSLDLPTTAAPQAHALLGVIEHIGGAHFVPALMDFCRETAGAIDCSFFVHRAGPPVRMGTARLAGLRSHNVGDCYLRDGYYRVDPTAQVTHRASDRLLLNCLSRDELPDHQWVSDYEAIGLAERLSLLVALDGGWGVLNAYRPVQCGLPLDSAIHALGSHGPLVASALRRHTALALPTEQAERNEPFDALSARERQVVDAILEGLSAKESARRLGLSPTSIATYRQRAFEKLGIQRQVQLFQLRSRTH